MKPFWDNYFADLEAGRIDQETFAMKAGAEIRDDLEKIEYLLKDFEVRMALDLIAELKQDF